MTKEKFKKLNEIDQFGVVSKQGEILINLHQGKKIVTVYRLGNLLIKVVLIDNLPDLQIINEAEISTLFQSA